MFCTGIFVLFVLRIRVVLMFSCFRIVGLCVCGGCIAGFLPKRSRLLDARVASSMKVACCLPGKFEIHNNVPSEIT